MAKTYFDKREGREKTVPNCAKHGLVWNPVSQRCEKVRGLGYMGADFYTDDYLVDGGGGYYDGDLVPGTISPGGEAIAWGGYLPPDYVPGFEPLPQQEPTYIPLEPTPSSFWSGQIGTGEQIGTPEWSQFYVDYISQGFNPDDAAHFADLDLEAAAGAGVIRIAGSEPGAPSIPTLPEIPQVSFPYIPFGYDYWQSPPYIPTIPEPGAPPPPGPQLPGYCPAGTYHPTWDPFACVPFPPAATTQQRPRPGAPTQPTPTPAPASRLPQQPTQRPRPAAPIQCRPPLVFDPRVNRCVQVSQISLPPVPTEAKDMFADLKNLPWWVWLALGGVVLLSMGGTERKTTTVRYKRG